MDVKFDKSMLYFRAYNTSDPIDEVRVKKCVYFQLGDLDGNYIIPCGLLIDELTTIEQYVGFLDAKNNMIFEGDILEKDGDRWAITHITDLYFDPLMRYRIEKDWLVIGNIHENPDIAYDS